jgi:polar amino acid transport system ATP-binding protein
MAEATPALEIRNLHKRYGELEVLKGISLTARDGDVISILGSSGSGKSTFLRCINLLENPHQGQILVAGEELKLKAAKNGELVAADGKQINRLRSEIGFVFQNFNLWPHMSVLDNIIEAPRRVLGQSKAEAIEVAEACWPRSASPTSATPTRRNCPAASNSVRPSPAPWPCSPRSSCSTSPPPPLTRKWSRKYLMSSAHWPKKAAPCCW